MEKKLSSSELLNELIKEDIKNNNIDLHYMHQKEINDIVKKDNDHGSKKVK